MIKTMPHFIFLIALILLFIAMILVLIRLYKGPTLYDRVLSTNSFGTHTVLFIGVLGFLSDRPDFLDIALLYALINFLLQSQFLNSFVTVQLEMY